MIITNVNALNFQYISEACFVRASGIADFVMKWMFWYVY